MTRKKAADIRAATPQDHKPKRTPEEMTRLARIGGYARAAKLTQEELSAAGKKARAARTARENARRASEGLPPREPAQKPLPEDVMQYWLKVVDETYPDRVYDNRMQRPRLAVRLAREAAAKAAEAAFRDRSNS
jgi:hypothetical protein